MWDNHPNASRCVNVVSEVKLLQHSGLCFMYGCITFPSPSTCDCSPIRKGNHPPRLPHLLLLPSLALLYRPLSCSSNCQCQNPAGSATKIIPGWLTCKAVKGNRPKRACRKVCNNSDPPSLCFSGVYQGTTPPLLMHVLCLGHGGSSRSISLYVTTV